MKNTIKDLSSSKKRIEFEITAAEFNKYLEKTLKDLMDDLEVSGFRKGRVPEELAKEKIDESKALEIAAQSAINDSWREFLSKQQIETVSQPEVQIIKIAKDNDFVFVVEIETLPEVKLPNIKSIASKIKKQEIKVENKEIEDAISWIQQSRAKLSEKEGTAEENDLVEIEICFIDKEDKPVKDAFIVGKGHYLKGLEQGIIGLKRGEEKEIEVLDNLNNKTNIKVKIGGVKKVELPEINDDWVKCLGSFQTLEELKNNIKQGITEEKEYAAKQKSRADLLEEISRKTEINIPLSLINKEEEALANNLKNRIERELNISFEEYLKQTMKNEEQFKKEINKLAVKRVKNFLILRQIEKEENITVEEAEIERKTNEALKAYSSTEQVQKNIDLNEFKMYIVDDIKREKIFNLFGL